MTNIHATHHLLHKKNWVEELSKNTLMSNLWHIFHWRMPSTINVVEIQRVVISNLCTALRNLWEHAIGRNSGSTYRSKNTSPDSLSDVLRSISWHHLADKPSSASKQKWQIFSFARLFASTGDAPNNGDDDYRFDGLFEFLLRTQHPDAAVRVSAIDRCVAFVQHPQRDFIRNLLCKLFKDEDWSVRTRAVQVAARFLNREVYNALLTVLYDDDDGTVRAAAVSSLRLWRDPIPTQHLLAALADRDWSVREMAVQILHELAKAGEVVPPEPLLKLLIDENEEEIVRETVAWVLQIFPTEELLESLKRGLQSRNEHVQHTCARLLWQQGTVYQQWLLITALMDDTGTRATVVNHILDDEGEYKLVQLLPSVVTTDDASQVPLLEFLQERLYKDLVSRNEPDNPLWRLCEPPQNTRIQPGRLAQFILRKQI